MVLTTSEAGAKVPTSFSTGAAELHDALVALGIPVTCVRSGPSGLSVSYAPGATPQQIALGDSTAAAFDANAAAAATGRGAAKSRLRGDDDPRAHLLRALAALVRLAINHDRQWMAAVRANLLNLNLPGLTLPAAPQQQTWADVLAALDAIIDARTADPT